MAQSESFHAVSSQGDEPNCSVKSNCVFKAHHRVIPAYIALINIKALKKYVYSQNDTIHR